MWECDKPHRNDDHPTVKPLALAVRALNNSSAPGDLVVDFFLGSGTTLIAAQKLGRTCYGMETEPRYCDVIVRRYYNLVGWDSASEEHIRRWKPKGDEING